MCVKALSGRWRQDLEPHEHAIVECQSMHFNCELERHAEAGSSDAVYARLAQRDFIDRHFKRLLAGLKGKLGDRQDIATKTVRFSEESVNLHQQFLFETEPEVFY